jgi:hypothetical protein
VTFSVPRSYWRIFLMIFFGGVFIFLLYHAFLLISSANSPDPWLIGDWLINYQGGLVRRGLTGEIFLRAAQLSGINIVVIVVAFQILMYSIFFINAYRLSINSSFSVLTAALIGSPAFILFPVLDPNGGFRKEIVLFALLSTLCFYLTSSDQKISKWLPVYIAVISVVMVFSHEMLLIYLPYIICAFIIYDKGLGEQAKKNIVSILPAIILGILLAFFYRGDKQVVIQICNSLKTGSPSDCFLPEITPGAISSLGQGIKSAHDFVVQSNNASTLLVYGFTTLLGLAPLVLIIFSKQFSKYKKGLKLRFWLSVCIFLIIVCSIPLFWIAADYGRLINIHITCLSLLALMMTQEVNSTPYQVNNKQIAAWGLCFLFVISWRLIHWEATFAKSFPLITLIKHLLGFG